MDSHSFRDIGNHLDQIGPDIIDTNDQKLRQTSSIISFSDKLR